MAASEKRRRRGGSARQRSWQQRRGLGPPRDFLGYGADPPQVRWPGNARIAINLNLNVEAGGEHSILEGDPQSENLLTDIGFPAYVGKRSPWSNPPLSMDRGSAASGCCKSSSASMSRRAFSAWYAACRCIPN